MHTPVRSNHVHGQLYFGCDHVKLQLLNVICSPQLDQSIMTALADCKNFGGMHLHSLLEPITCRHPFEFLVADYLSLPKGTNGFHTVGLYLNTYSQHIWGFKHKTHGTAKTTISRLTTIPIGWTKPDMFMMDGGSHFKNNEVVVFYKERGIKHEVIVVYSVMT